MKSIGMAIIFIGCLVCAYALTMDTSIINHEFGSRINNIGLMNTQQNFIYLAGIMILSGVFLVGAGEICDVLKNHLKQIPDAATAGAERVYSDKSEPSYNNYVPIALTVFAFVVIFIFFYLFN